MLPSRAPYLSLDFVLPAAFTLLRRLNAGGLLSRDALLRALQMPPDEFDACICALREYGVMVRVSAAGCYTLAEPADLLDAGSLASHLHERGAQVRVSVRDECISTNAMLLARVSDDEFHAQALACELQTAGRGRRGKTWQSGLADSLTFSLGWRIKLPVQALSGLSLAVAVACAHSLTALGIDDVAVKWPNDLMRAGAKLGGILIEIARSECDYTDVVIGIGMNVHVRDTLRADIDQRIADMGVAGRAMPSRNLLLAGVLHELEIGLRQFERSGFRAFKSEWLRLHAFEGRRVRMAMNERESVEGLTSGVDDEGALLVLTEGGMRRFHAGEISLREAA